MIMRLSLLAALAAVAVLTAVALGGPGQGATSQGNGGSGADRALRGIPQSGIVIGSPDGMASHCTQVAPSPIGSSAALGT